MGATTFLARSRRDDGSLVATEAGSADGSGAADPTPRTGRAGAQQWTLAPGTTVAMPGAPVQDLWLAMRRSTWRSVAVAPTWSGSSELVLAEQLVVVGVADTRPPVTLVSARGIGVAEVEDVLAMVRAATLRAELVVVVADALVDNPATAAVTRALDAVVLTVRMGVSSCAEVERAVAAASPATVLGVVTRP